MNNAAQNLSLKNRHANAVRTSTLAILAIILLGTSACSEPTKPLAPGSDAKFSKCYTTASWAAAPPDGKIVRTKHYEIFTTMHADQSHRILANFMEAACARYMFETNLPAPRGKMPVYMLATRKQWRSIATGMFGQNDPATQLENGGYTIHGVMFCWNIGGDTTFSVASHEGLHQFLYYHMKTTLPVWAEEGFATCFEAFKMTDRKISFFPQTNPMRLPALKIALLSDTFMLAEDLVELTPAEVIKTGCCDLLEYYAQLYALVSFIRSHPQYKAGFDKMLRDAKAGHLKLDRENFAKHHSARKGKNARMVFEHYITDNFVTFNKEFRAYSRKITGLILQK